MENKFGQSPSPKNESAIVDSGELGTYLINDAPKVNEREDALTIQVGTTSGEAQRSSNTCDLAIPHIPSDFPGPDFKKTR